MMDVSIRASETRSVTVISVIGNIAFVPTFASGMDAHYCALGSGLSDKMGELKNSNANDTSSLIFFFPHSA